MITESMVDYIVFNTNIMPNLDWSNEEDSMSRNYDKCVKSSCGTVAHYGSKSTDKIHVVMSGTPCRQWQYELGTKGFCEWVMGDDEKCSVTRLDLAITQFIDHDGLITVDDIADYYLADMIDCKHVKHGSSGWIDGKKKGIETFNIGSFDRRAKHGIFRAYDKGLEMDLDKYLITRFEIEEKRDSAMSSINRILNGASVNQVFKSRFDVSCDEWQKMIDCDPIDITRGKAKSETDKVDSDLANANRWAWAIQQIAPAIGDALFYDIHHTEHGSKNFGLFLEAIEKAYDKNTLE